MATGEARSRRRIDQLLVERGLFESRARAQAAIAAGGVLAGGRPVRKASEAVPADCELTAAPAHPWVSRGGVKLAFALEAFGVSPAGLTCLDVGSSTGGFTQVLLAAGAAQVHAVDSGRDQMHASLRGDPRLDLREGCDIRTLRPGDLPAPPGLAVIDVSFISLRLVLPAAARLLAAGSDVLALVKPQFEVGRAAIGKGGIVRDSAARRTAAADIVACLEGLGYAAAAPLPSPIAGGDGNEEWLVHGRRCG